MNTEEVRRKMEGRETGGGRVNMLEACRSVPASARVDRCFQLFERMAKELK